MCILINRRERQDKEALKLVDLMPNVKRLIKSPFDIQIVAHPAMGLPFIQLLDNRREVFFREIGKIRLSRGGKLKLSISDPKVDDLEWDQFKRELSLVV